MNSNDALSQVLGDLDSPQSSHSYEKIFLDQRVQSLILSYNRLEAMWLLDKWGAKNSNYHVEHLLHDFPSEQEIEEEKSAAIDNRRTKLQHGRTWYLLDPHESTLMFPRGKAVSQSLDYIAQDHWTLLPTHRNRFVQHDIRGLRRQSQSQASATSSVSSTSGRPRQVENCVLLLSADKDEKATIKESDQRDNNRSTTIEANTAVAMEVDKRRENLRQHLSKARYLLRSHGELLAGQSIDSAADSQESEERTDQVANGRKKATQQDEANPLREKRLTHSYRPSITFDSESLTSHNRSSWIGCETFAEFNIPVDDWIEDSFEDTGDLLSLSLDKTPTRVDLSFCENNNVILGKNQVNRQSKKSKMEVPFVTRIATVRSPEFDPFPSTTSEDFSWDDEVWSDPAYSSESEPHEVENASRDDLRSVDMIHVSNVVVETMPCMNVPVTTAHSMNEASNTRASTNARNASKLGSEKRCIRFFGSKDNSNIGIKNNVRKRNSRVKDSGQQSLSTYQSSPSRSSSSVLLGIPVSPTTTERRRSRKHNEWYRTANAFEVHVRTKRDSKMKEWLGMTDSLDEEQDVHGQRGSRMETVFYDSERRKNLE
mmetsp:Transcript_10498/g.22334  ORF Transcript_10498/g.22334 Transcript_10498/m.22334 type:complete len:598 (-) Transcript_10498:393-2186(-)|eukprot:CAMPEP_0168224266 /NCGR_PEP_ID=MMETSP0140_2-20121125/11927_1 /TAXON_ID=44445 /ORGANISM="Pseudo-nitzschia australis, Strain 10249 10 AB" /LENGTH=597 /DNA_ID=CAMNT_0008154553 /DNA_START=100 /DNA_END=1893 /DNA_ORIENTATION=+